jgi:hypothetical protein
MRKLNCIDRRTAKTALPTRRTLSPSYLSMTTGFA